MAIDGIMLAACRKELSEKLQGAKINKIYQPQANFLTIDLRNNQQNYQLLVVIDPRQSRVHISRIDFSNPPKPPTFTMVLRKHLTQGRIASITQPGLERMLEIEIVSNTSKYQLYLEIMGRYSNVILADAEDNILDAMKRMGPDANSSRELIPKAKYQYPPAQDKINPYQLTREEQWWQLVGDDFRKYAYRAILNNVQGIGPESAREIVYQAAVEPETNYHQLSQQEKIAIKDSLFNYLTLIQEQDFQPVLGINQAEEIVYQSAFPLEHKNDVEDKEFASLGELFDYYYQEHILKQDFLKEKDRLQKIVNNYLEKNERQQNKVHGKLQESSSADKYQRWGELLKSQLHKITPGQEEVTVVDYYQEGQPEISIPLNSELSPAENAKKYFKKQRKLKKSRDHLIKELARLRHESKYLKEVEVNIEQAEDSEDLAEIKEELREENYLQQQKQKKNKAARKSPPRKYYSSQGYQILVGRNNRQNDRLTKKVANSDDLWVHTRKIAGSHVIVKNHTDSQIPQETIEEACLLAAYFSKARQSSNVPVDFTRVKNVRKPKGAKPGIVYYDNHETLYITPDDELIAEIAKNKAPN